MRKGRVLDVSEPAPVTALRRKTGHPRTRLTVRFDDGETEILRVPKGVRVQPGDTVVYDEGNETLSTFALPL